MHTDSLALADGRTLAFITYGDLDGTPVVFSHGFGDSRLIRNPDDALTASLGVRMIAPDQPAVGGSSPHKGRTLTDWANDVERLVDALGIERFAVAGHSGGGPHTLAIAAKLKDRVTRGVLASPIGPLDLPDFDNLIASKELRAVLKMRRFHHLLHGILDVEAWIGRRDVKKYMSSMAKMDASDAPTFYASDEQKAMFEASFAAGIEQGGDGMDELLEAVWDWGFGLEDVPQPFDLFYGDADDLLAPEMGPLVAARMPRCAAHRWPGAGHYGFVDSERWIDFLTPLSSSD